MPNEYRYLTFGIVPVDFNNQQLEVTETIFKSFLRTNASFNLLSNTESHLEIFKLAKQYIGNDFRKWCIVNYRDSSGSRSGLIKSIVNWIRGSVSTRGLISAINVDLNRIDFLDTTEKKPDTSIIFNDRNKNKAMNFDDVQDIHFFKLLSVIGPELTAKLFLSFNGINFVK